MEAEAATIRTFEPILVPGLLQTEGYARGMMRANLVSTEIDRRVTARMERQRLLDRNDPPQLWTVIDENALTRPAVGAHSGTGGSFMILGFPNPDFFAPVVFLETDTDGLYLEKPEEISPHAHVDPAGQSSVLVRMHPCLIRAMLRSFDEQSYVVAGREQPSNWNERTVQRVGSSHRVLPDEDSLLGRLTNPSDGLVIVAGSGLLILVKSPGAPS